MTHHKIRVSLPVIIICLSDCLHFLGAKLGSPHLLWSTCSTRANDMKWLDNVIYCYGFGSYYGQVVDNWNTIDWEFFTLWQLVWKFFVLLKFSQFRSILKTFLAVDNCNMDKLLENSWSLVYYQVSGELGIAGCSFRLDIYLGECGLAHSLFTDHRRVILFFVC